MAKARTISRDREEISRLLTAQYPLVHRLAIGLCGSEVAAAAVTRTVFTQSLAVLDRWRTEAQAANWFLHHTLLESRGGRSRSAIWTWGGGQFARAWSSLPFQQKEAFLLTEGEKLDGRRMAIAMDCSTTAAANHLAAATAALRAAAGAEYEAALQKMTAAYLAPPPPPNLVLANAARAVIRRRRLRRVVGLLVALLAAVCAYMAWRIYGMLDY